MTKSRPPQPGLTRKHIARAEREAMLQGWVLIGTAAVVVIVLGLIGYGLLDQYVLRPRQPVAKVNNVEITTAEFQKAVKYRRVQLINQYAQIAQIIQLFGNDPNTALYYQSQLNQIQTQLSDPTAIGRVVLNNLIEDEIIRQEAAKRDISIPPDEVEKALQEAFGYYANGTPTPFPTPTFAPTDTPTPLPTLARGVTPTLTPTTEPTATLIPTLTPTVGPSPTPFPTATPFTLEAFQKGYHDFVSRLTEQTGMTDTDVRRIFELQVLRDKVREAVTADTPRDTLEAHARHILVDDEATAKDIIAQLQSGADFAELAAKYSKDTSNKDSGGDLGTFPPGRMVPEFDQVVFNVGLGLYAEPVKTTSGYHVIEILSRDTRQLTDSEYKQKQNDAFDEWLQGQRDSTDLVTEYDVWQLRVPTKPAIEDVLNQPTPKP